MTYIHALGHEGGPGPYPRPSKRTSTTENGDMKPGRRNNDEQRNPFLLTKYPTINIAVGFTGVVASLLTLGFDVTGNLPLPKETGLSLLEQQLPIVIPATGIFFYSAFNLYGGWDKLID